MCLTHTCDGIIRSKKVSVNLDINIWELRNVLHFLNYIITFIVSECTWSNRTLGLSSI